jgi:triphosphoribosyl-dephospho-CoA synthase
MDWIGLYAQLACMWEATARKPGNVHRYRDFEDASYLDFLHSAAAIAPVLSAVAAGALNVGQGIHEAIRLTRTVVPSNTNLGIVLLLTPLAAVPLQRQLREGITDVLNQIDLAQTAQVFDAIRLANPGGLGRVEDQDVASAPTLPLRQVMALAADRDLVARQYANAFLEVLQEGVAALQQGLEQTRSLEGTIIFCHLHLLAHHPDSLIARKRGRAEAEEASSRAGEVLRSAWPQGERGRQALAQLDAWLRAEGHRRNPGTTADLVTASLFAALREGIITLPPQLPWSCGDHHDDTL